MVYKITDLHSKPRKIKINSFMQWIKVGRIWTLLRGTGHETTHNRSHLELIIYFQAEVRPVADYANIDIL